MARATKTRKRQPQRTCVGCREVKGKRQLTRIVRLSDGHVIVDPSGKKQGRGAYICADLVCWQKAVERRAVERALKCEVSLEDRQAMAAYFEALVTPVASDE